MKSPCIAFKMNYCDGGRDEDHVGFRGICSYENMYYNVFEARPPRRWCSNRRCDCRRYLDEWITWRDLNKKVREGFFPCMDSVALIDWCMEAGSTADGSTTKKIRQGEENHLCIFTTREPETSEKDRFVFAMFIMHEIFSGDDETAGYVTADNYWRLEFRPNEAKQIKFWDFYQNKDGSTLWGSELIRYFDDALAVKFLERAVEVKRGKEKNFAKEFLKHYQYK